MTKTTRKTKRPARPTGRAGKDKIMPRARKLALEGGARGFKELLPQLGRDRMTLAIWATRHDRDEIDRLCAQGRVKLKAAIKRAERTG